MWFGVPSQFAANRAKMTSGAVLQFFIAESGVGSRIDRRGRHLRCFGPAAAIPKLNTI